MLFSSISFIFYFLPIVCLLYLLAGRKLRNYILLLASIFFYAWGEPRYVAIMLAIILISYAGAIGMERFRRAERWILAVSISGDLGFLIFFKYFDFLAENVQALFGGEVRLLGIAMPLGISFYTFQAVSYLVDVYRREVPAQKNPGKLALYIALFPQLVAGPIVKYHDVAAQLDSRRHGMEKVAYGVKRFIMGLGKKVLIANTMGCIADKVFEQSVTNFDTLTAWVGICAYSMQLYFDFSGYSDMAIGLGAIFGFKFMENFNYPYISRSITEFWRRWHISLSTWFRQYLYIPLGGNRVSRWRMYLNLFAVFAVTGIWHGADWAFLVWGMWHGVFIVLEKATGWHKAGNTCLVRTVQRIYTVMVVLTGWVFFRAADLSYGWRYLCRMFGGGGELEAKYHLVYYVDNLQILVFAIAVCCCTPLFRRLRPGTEGTRWISNAWLLVVFILSTSSILASTYNPFIYFRF